MVLREQYHWSALPIFQDENLSSCYALYAFNYTVIINLPHTVVVGGVCMHLVYFAFFFVSLVLGFAVEIKAYTNTLDFLGYDGYRKI